MGDDGLILSSTDSGSTWITISSGVGSNLESIFFVSTSTAYIAGRDGTILKSSQLEVPPGHHKPVEPPIALKVLLLPLPKEAL
ncbi:MAG: hypothetical protein U5L96_04335 [Owenweeksia sp.]|nr:hypothetical protein [Owenweeksia sp.]